MKQLVSTKFVCALQKASQAGVDIDAQVLADDYDEFADIVLSFTDGVAFHNTLSYTRAELVGLTLVSEKKRGYMPAKSHRAYRCAN